MASDESDDEPLSVLAAAKKTNPEEFAYEILSVHERESKRRKLIKNSGLTIKINRKLNTITSVATPVIDRPTDVWLYLKDLNPTGPYKCLLCADWFINRSKMVVHYILNHKKDFCGICRYFVTDRESWTEHSKFHTPWPCSQCVETFHTEVGLRQHLGNVHKLVHCRLCHFRLPVGEEYESHLFQKHNVTNTSCKDEEVFWELDVQRLPKFNCFLCSKTDNLTSTFFTHYMGFHHFTLKCITSFISGSDPPFTVHGAEVSSQFVDGELRGLNALGYIDGEQKPNENNHENNQSETTDPSKEQVEQKPKTEFEEKDDENSHRAGSQNESVDDTQGYEGDEDFDITLTELIVLQKCYFDYIKQTLDDISKKLVPEKSDIDNNKAINIDVNCTICETKYQCVPTFVTHMYKMHCIRSEPEFSCRVCATTFETCDDLETHILEELGDFEDLWLCQFCDKEFDNRVETRKHLTEHWESIEYDNCFSPHLGFKCRFCPTLFWNEIDRETHQVRVHLNKHSHQFYKCNSCMETFSDKVWFIHHYIEKHVKDGVPVSTFLLKCSVCCIVLPSVDEMRNHFDTDHPEARKFYCSLDPCKYKPLSQRKSFKLHMKTVHGSSRSEKPVACPVCTREFPSVRSCNAHAAQVHGPGKFKCKLCMAVLHTVDERKLHYLLIHPGRHPFECSVCGKSFQYKSSLYMHKQEHQPNKQSYTCNYCSKVFVKKDSFREHLQIHEGPRHACSYCPMRFVQRSNMLRHERRHTGERPYACPHCPRTFADKGACTSHARTHSKESSYACIYCGQTFVQKSKLTYHVRKHTGENLETCSICAKLFTSPCALREHMKIHLCKKESVKCPLCDKKYQDERYMLRHLRTSHTRTQFSCPICQKVVTTGAGLRHHVITHSPLNTFRCKICPKSYAVKRTIVKHLRRRHSLTSPETNLKDYYTRLEPRQCKLNLDEATMTGIFGPPKNTTSEIIISDYITYKKEPKSKKKDTKNTDEDKDSESSEEEGSQKEGNEQEDSDHNGEDLEPTDFVSVKIEPLDEYDSME
ncbi:uncharacterized protein [Epargyreus clarus]|uniref:uncharacterized protein n=1 Tax=Epargyreus clarus TaxID=520877 RepID=UPI003C2B2120